MMRPAALARSAALSLRPGAEPVGVSGVGGGGGGGEVASAPAEAPGAAEVIAPPPYQLTEPEVAEPGFNAVPGGHR